MLSPSALCIRSGWRGPSPMVPWLRFLDSPQPGRFRFNHLLEKSLTLISKGVSLSAVLQSAPQTPWF
jgi:hypothetical protein